MVSCTATRVLVLCCFTTGLVKARSPDIINGENAASPGIYPWQASFQTSRGYHFCGASLISERWLVTAAHCTEPQIARNVKIVLGMYDKKKKRYGKPKSYRVARMFEHPRYDSKDEEMANDIALIQLQTDAELNDMVQPISLPDLGQSFEGNSDCVVSGWGELGWNGRGPNILQALPVQVKASTWCEQYAPTPDYRVCIRPTKEDGSACRGDSGGPLACKSDGEWVLAGDASFVLGKCDTDKPNWYTNVAHFRMWIAKKAGV